MNYTAVVLGLAAAGGAATVCAQEAKPLRPPAVPLVTHDPYFSTWSCADKLTDDWPRHWTGKPMGLSGMVRIDGHPFRWCGADAMRVPAMEQKSITVTPLTSTYEFAAAGVGLTVKFVSAAVAGSP
jgi:hypothetical protein